MGNYATIALFLVALYLCPTGASTDTITREHAVSIAAHHLGDDGCEVALWTHSDDHDRRVWVVAGPRGSVTIDAADGEVLVAPAAEPVDEHADALAVAPGA